MKNWLQPYKEYMRESNNMVERFAHKWCIETLISVNEVKKLKNAVIVNYEELTTGIQKWRPISKLLSIYNWSNELCVEHLCKPSFTTERDPSDVRQRKEANIHLDFNSKLSIKRIVDIYGLSSFLAG